MAVESLHPPAELLTERLRLRPPALDDAEAIFRAYATDPEVTRFVPWAPHADLEVTRTFLRDAVARWQERQRAPFVIETRAEWRLLGMIDLTLVPPRLSFGYVIARAEWGRGYATEAARAVVRWALAQPAVMRVTAFCDAEHRASARVLEKAGLLREGLLREHFVFGNIGPAPRDCLSFGAVPAGAAGIAAGRPDPADGEAPRVLVLDHVQLSMPPGGEDAARAFYGGVLGLAELRRPADMQGRGGCWFGAGAVRLHLGVEQDFRPARKAHPALAVAGLPALLARCAAAGHPVSPAVPLDGAERAHVLDPFGNRLELIAVPGG
jgi:[ribosomal protein S5]-alanine N-acetyltransferase